MQDGSSLSTAKTLPPPADPLVGRVIAGKFLVNEWLGTGAMGIVYRATQLALDRTVAIKVLHHEFAADAHFAERFAREAKAASRLDHPNSIHVFDFGQEPDGLLYLAIEFVEGFDLFEWLADHSPVAPRAIVDLLSQVLAALAVAHDMGVIHRDLKPENIMIVRGTSDEGREVDVVKVCDFGIAKILQPATEPSSAPTEPRRKRSSTGLIVGTPAYMSPEQARGEQLDARSDLYAVGIVLYELLTGNVPFEAETPLGFALKHVSEPPARPSARVASVDPELEAICLQALSKNPADRYQNAREMRLALQRFASKLAPLPLVTTTRASPRWTGCHLSRQHRGCGDPTRGSHCCCSPSLGSSLSLAHTSSRRTAQEQASRQNRSHNPPPRSPSHRPRRHGLSRFVRAPQPNPRRSLHAGVC